MSDKIIQMNNYKYDGIILDIDGTIWDTTPIVSGAWNNAIDELGFTNRAAYVNSEILKKEFGKTMDIIADDLWPELSKEEKNKLMKECCTQEHAALKNDECKICYPNVKEIVKELSDKINFYVVSNCQDGYIQLMLEKTGLSSYVKDFECFGHTKKGKAENLIDIINRNKIEKPVYIGDTNGDCNECKKAQVPFIWASYGFGKADSYVAKLEDFSELTKFIL